MSVVHVVIMEVDIGRVMFIVHVRVCF